jgi:glycosyltransferase involved in cell wall biosynthesis
LTERRIRVLRVIARMNVGGPALQVVGLIEGMDAEGFDHRVLAGRVEEGEADYLALRAPGAEVEYVEGLGRSIRLGDDVGALRHLVREMRAFRPDIVHTHTAKAGVLGRVAAQIARVPFTVHTFHGHLLQGYFSPSTTAAVRTVERALARGTTRLVAVGAQVRDELLDAGVGRADQYVVVPPGVALRAIPSEAEARALLGLPADGLVVGYLARLTTIKRPDRFVEVARELSAKHPGVTFAVAGDGPLLDEMRQLASDLADCFRFLGFRSDVETVYAASDLVMLTSDNEGMPVSLIEASLAGRPGVTTDVGSAGEVVIDGVTGFVTPPRVADLAAAASKLLEDPGLRARMADAARRHAEEHFGRARLVSDTEELYRSLVRGGA